MKITIPRETFDAMREALENIAGDKWPDPEMTAEEYAREALSAAKAVSAEETDSLGIPLSCGGPLCSPKNHHPYCKLHVQPQAQWHLLEKRDIDDFDPNKATSTYFRGLGWNECIDAMSSTHPQASEPEKSLHELLRMGAEENEQLKAQLAGMEKLLRFKEAMDASGTSKDARTWCEYVAGMVGTYLNEPVDSDKCKAIAGIIERRLWALPAAPGATK